MKINNLLIAIAIANVIVITFYSGVVFAKYVLSDEYLKALLYGFFLLIQVWCVISIFKRSE